MEKEKKYVLISGFNIHDNNRGTSALAYGSISFLEEKHGLANCILLNIRIYKNFLKKKNRHHDIEIIKIEGKEWRHEVLPVFFPLYILLKKFNVLIPFTKLSKYWKCVEYVAAINGGDGFSDIYSTSTFLNRLPDIEIAMQTKKKLIFLPQTLGPFEMLENRKIAENILRYVSKIYVRDDCFESELKRMGIAYEKSNDLSAFMKPSPVDIDIPEGALGINISGLAYSNKFRDLSGQFDNYPYLIEKIIESFQKQQCIIYLISHSYNYSFPETANDDLEASRTFYYKLKDKTGVVLVDRNLTSPETKYLISKMSFFIGTRMHANFAAIFTKVPVFGLAYSYKFQGAFETNGLYGQTVMINNITNDKVHEIVALIDDMWKKCK